MPKKFKKSDTGKIKNDIQMFLTVHKYLPIKDIKLFINFMKLNFEEEFMARSTNNTIYFCEKCFNFVSRFQQYQKSHNRDMTAPRFYKKYLKDDGSEFLELAKKCGFYHGGFAVCPGFTSDFCFDNETQNAGLCLWGEISKEKQNPSSPVFKPLHSKRVQARMDKNAKRMIIRRSWYKRDLKKYSKKQKAAEDKKPKMERKKRTPWKKLYISQV